jgi:hypothetical protein
MPIPNEDNEEDVIGLTTDAEVLPPRKSSQHNF